MLRTVPKSQRSCALGSSPPLSMSRPSSAACSPPATRHLSCRSMSSVKYDDFFAERMKRCLSRSLAEGRCADRPDYQQRLCESRRDTLTCKGSRCKQRLTNSRKGLEKRSASSCGGGFFGMRKRTSRQLKFSASLSTAILDRLPSLGADQHKEVRLWPSRLLSTRSM